MSEDRLAQIEAFPALVKMAILEAENTEELVDTLGAVNSTQTRIGKLKLDAASEVADEEAGSKWRYEQSMRGVRTFNDSGMFATLMGELGYDNLVGLIRFLLDGDIVRIQWQWSNLQKLMRHHNVELRKAGWAVKEGDPDYDYGEYWVHGSAGYQPVKEE